MLWYCLACGLLGCLVAGLLAWLLGCFFGFLVGGGAFAVQCKRSLVGLWLLRCLVARFFAWLPISFKSEVGAGVSWASQAFDGIGGLVGCRSGWLPSCLMPLRSNCCGLALALKRL